MGQDKKRVGGKGKSFCACCGGLSHAERKRAAARYERRKARESNRMYRVVDLFEDAPSAIERTFQEIIDTLAGNDD